MGFQCGIVGLPNVGKSTIFNALTSAKAEAANYPFCTIEPNTGIVKVPDPRLSRIAQYIPTDKQISATMVFVDIAGPRNWFYNFPAPQRRRSGSPFFRA